MHIAPVRANIQDQPAAEIDERAIVAAAQVDRSAFAPLYRRYVGPVYRYCHARLGSREAAEDATGEIFAKVLAALPRYRERVFVAWLFTIAHNVVIDAQRRARPAAPLDLVVDLAAPDQSPEEMTLARVESDDLWAAIGALQGEQRATIELQLIGWRDSQIAAALDRSPAAVRMLRLRALGRLRAFLTARGRGTNR